MIDAILRESKVGIKLHFCIVWLPQNQNENNHFPGIRETFWVVILKTIPSSSSSWDLLRMKILVSPSPAKSEPLEGHRIGSLRANKSSWGLKCTWKLRTVLFRLGMQLGCENPCLTCPKPWVWLSAPHKWVFLHACSAVLGGRSLRSSKSSASTQEVGSQPDVLETASKQSKPTNQTNKNSVL